MKIRLTPIALLLLAFGAGAVHAACITEAQALDMADKYMAKQPIAAPEVASEQDAACGRAKINVILEQRLGAPVGYKAGLTNPAVQKRFGADQPVWGKMYKTVLIPSGSEVDAGFGTRPLFEADMLVRVKDAGINHATTPMEVLEHIDQIIPFIELPDLLVDNPAKLNGNALSLLNVGSRAGIAGTPIAVPATRAERYQMVDALANMNVVLADDSGPVLGRGKGSDILGHPLNAVIWLAQSLAKENMAMKPGEVISLGSFSPLVPPKAGLKASATYEGLPGAQPVSVRFR